jgi:flagellar biosynthesis anti-sigma factor FlgM
MKISRPNPQATSELNPAVGVGPSSAGLAAKQPVASRGASDQVQLSSLSSYLASALSGSPVHLAKLTELGAAVSNGQYRVDAFAVSGSIIQHSIEFGGGGYSGLNVAR